MAYRSGYPYYPLEAAKTKLFAAVREGRVRVEHNGALLTGEEAIALLESDERSARIVAEDVMREFPPMPPAGHA